MLPPFDQSVLYNSYIKIYNIVDSLKILGDYRFKILITENPREI